MKIKELNKIHNKIIHTEKAFAKINLTLNVFKKDLNGLHNINSIVAFTDLYDSIEFYKNKKTHLLINNNVDGVISKLDNIIIKSDSIFRSLCPGSDYYLYKLDKYIPIAAGLGGGSADAAAIFRGLCKINNKQMSDIIGSGISDTIGSDVTACLFSKLLLLQGTGEKITTLDNNIQLFALLVNPNKEISTKKVFSMIQSNNLRTDNDNFNQLNTDNNLLEFIINGKNDLQDIACSLVPEINRILLMIQRTDKCIVSRMSGSGATCFGLYENLEYLDKAYHHIINTYPDYWCKKVSLF